MFAEFWNFCFKAIELSIRIAFPAIIHYVRNIHLTLNLTAYGLKDPFLKNGNKVLDGLAKYF
jgi:hypothetical protein